MMNRDEALEYTTNYVRWPSVNAHAGNLPHVPTGWAWKVISGVQLLVHSVHDPINYSDWATAVDLSPSPVTTLLTAPDFLECGAQHMRDRAAQRDKPDGERSMARAVAAFNAQEGTSLTEEQGWRFMVQLKYSRACAGVFVADDYEDMAAYAGLAGESAQ